MPVYRYRAVDPAGDVATGELEAANESEIVDRLRDQGMLPMQVAPALGGAPSATVARAAAKTKARGGVFGLFVPKTVSRDQLLALTRELATLMRAGLPLDRALEVLIGLADSPPAASLLQQIRDDVRGGKALSQALDVRRDIFSRFYVNIVRAGEAGGALGVVLARLADTMERNKELRESVKSALIYPCILIGVAVLSVMVLLVWVVPQFEQTFAQAGKALPLATQIVILLGTGLRNWWWAVIAAVVACVWLIRRRLANPAVRLAFDARVLRSIDHEGRPAVVLDRTTLRLSPHGLAPPVAALESGSAVWILRRSPGWVMVEAQGSQRGWLADEAVAAVGG